MPDYAEAAFRLSGKKGPIPELDVSYRVDPISDDFISKLALEIKESARSGTLRTDSGGVIRVQIEIPPSHLRNWTIFPGLITLTPLLGTFRQSLRRRVIFTEPPAAIINISLVPGAPVPTPVPEPSYGPVVLFGVGTLVLGLLLFPRIFPKR